MLQRMLVVLDAAGNALAGDIEVGQGERSWSFRPHAAWLPGSYAVEIDPDLEDIAGNSIARPFENPSRDHEDDEAPRAREPVRLRFEVAS